jgi:hypothetical protein
MHNITYLYTTLQIIMASHIETCYLLTIPREIRYYIYDLVMHLSLSDETVWKYQHGFGNGGFFTRIYKESETSFSLPWINLLTTCRTISKEMRLYMSPSSAVDNPQKYSWILDIVAGQVQLEAAQWRQISCPPTSVNTLVANIEFPGGRAQFRGDGGPMPILQQLYQTLNRVLHYGLNFGGHRHLSQHLRFKTLVLNLKTSPGHEYGSSEHHNSWVFERFDHMSLFINRLEHTGVLWGYIESIGIVDMDGHHELDVIVQPDENPRVPNAWNGYGFQWGVSTSPGNLD